MTEGALKSLAVERALGSRFFDSVNHAALGGSQVRPEHVVKLSEFPMVVVSTDAGAAGESAGDELEGALSRHVRTARLRLPAGTDHDTVEREYLRGVLFAALGFAA